MFLRVSGAQPASRRAEIRRAQIGLSGIPLSLKAGAGLWLREGTVSFSESALFLSVRGRLRPPPLFEKQKSPPLQERDRDSSLSLTP